MVKYNNYKESGLRWFGDIPSHWEIERLKNIFAFCTGLSITKKNLHNKGVPCVSYGEIHSKFGFELNPAIHSLKCVNIDYLNTSKKSLLKKGDFIFADTSEDIEGSGNFTYLNSDIPVFAGYHTIMAKPKIKFDYRYIAYLIDSSSFRTQFQSSVAGIKVYSITQGLLKRLLIYIPTLNEQISISQHLDIKTSSIDKKINLLQQKLKYYKAYRKTLINDVVTKGLNKEVQLKKCDINWLSVIPKHWQIKRVKDVFNISRGRAIAKTELKDNGKYPVYSSQTKNKGILGYINTFDFNADLLTWTTDGVNAGTVFIREGKFNCTNICGTLIPKKRPKLSLDYMAFAVQESTQHNKRIDTNGAKIMSNEMAVIDIVFPPLEEQIDIASYINSKTKTIAKILKNIEAQIATLKELRKTLINEVVTGKVKVTA